MKHTPILVYTAHLVVHCTTHRGLYRTAHLCQREGANAAAAQIECHPEGAKLLPNSYQACCQGMTAPSPRRPLSEGGRWQPPIMTAECNCHPSARRQAGGDAGEAHRQLEERSSKRSKSRCPIVFLWITGLCCPIYHILVHAILRIRAWAWPCNSDCKVKVASLGRVPVNIISETKISEPLEIPTILSGGGTRRGV